MFNPQKIFPIVRNSIQKGSDQEVMGALTKLAQAHPELNEMQALAALQAYSQKQGMGAQPQGGKQRLSEYLEANKNESA